MKTMTEDFLRRALRERYTFPGGCVKTADRIVAASLEGCNATGGKGGISQSCCVKALELAVARIEALQARVALLRHQMSCKEYNVYGNICNTCDRLRRAVRKTTAPADGGE